MGDSHDVQDGRLTFPKLPPCEHDCPKVVYRAIIYKDGVGALNLMCEKCGHLFVQENIFLDNIEFEENVEVIKVDKNSQSFDILINSAKTDAYTENVKKLLPPVKFRDETTD